MEMKYLKYSSSSLFEEECKDKKPMFKDNSSSELFQWPSCKNYTCSFCKREFKSAQALGGHMNVHRRERARLRQLPSWILQFHNPKAPTEPNPTRHCSYPPSPSTLFSPMDRRDRIDFPDEGSGNVVREEGIHIRIEDEIKRKGKYARLDLKMGLEKEASDSNLDLELRLGNL